MLGKMTYLLFLRVRSPQSFQKNNTENVISIIAPQIFLLAYGPIQKKKTHNLSSTNHLRTQFVFPPSLPKTGGEEETETTGIFHKNRLTSDKSPIHQVAFLSLWSWQSVPLTSLLKLTTTTKKKLRNERSAISRIAGWMKLDICYSKWGSSSRRFVSLESRIQWKRGFSVTKSPACFKHRVFHPNSH